MVAVLGMDLSLVGSAAVWMGSEWSPEEAWVVDHVRLSAEGELLGRERRRAIVDGLLRFAHERRIDHAFVEEHSFSKGLGSSAFPRAELVGAVKDQFERQLGVVVHPVVASHARKVMFGRVRKMNRAEWKSYIKEAFGMLGWPGGKELPDEDTRDAYVVANAGRHVLGIGCLQV